jgi:class 3 adenylate cyclase
MAIHEFEGLTQSRDPLDLIEFLNDLFCTWDDMCADQRGLVKIETVGEVYLAASGLFGGAFDRNDECSGLVKLAHFALSSQRIARGKSVELRMGLHCGPIVAGIVGDKLPRFRLFGDTVNAAARLEQHCPPSHFLASEKVAEEVHHSTGLQVERHGAIEMKGLGEVATYQIRLQETLPPTQNLNIDETASFSDPSPEDERKRQFAHLPELEMEKFLTPPEKLVTLPDKVFRRGMLPEMSPIWRHLALGLQDPACLAAETPQISNTPETPGAGSLSHAVPSTCTARFFDPIDSIKEFGASDSIEEENERMDGNEDDKHKACTDEPVLLRKDMRTKSLPMPLDSHLFEETEAEDRSERQKLPIRPDPCTQAGFFKPCHCLLSHRRAGSARVSNYHHAPRACSTLLHQQLRPHSHHRRLLEKHA